LSGWSLIGAWEWGFNPYYGFPAAAQQAQVNQNGKLFFWMKLSTPLFHLAL
jgi:hypothetical protein